MCGRMFREPDRVVNCVVFALPPAPVRSSVASTFHDGGVRDGEDYELIAEQG